MNRPTTGAYRTRLALVALSVGGLFVLSCARQPPSSSGGELPGFFIGLLHGFLMFFSLLRRALAAKVAFVPGSSFHPRGGGAATLRLNFSYCAPEVIEVGIRRLGAVLERHLSGPAATA